MKDSTFVRIVLLSLLLVATCFASQGEMSGLLIVRQNVAPQVAAAPTDPQCVRYLQIANMGVIGKNSTYRTAFLQASKVGTLANKQMLDTAVKQLPPLTVDPALNQACGNFTDIALKQAETNFTQGIVAQFTGISAKPGAISAGPEVVITVLAIMLFFFIVLCFSQ